MSHGLPTVGPMCDKYGSLSKCELLCNTSKAYLDLDDAEEQARRAVAV